MGTHFQSGRGPIVIVNVKKKCTKQMNQNQKIKLKKKIINLFIKLTLIFSCHIVFIPVIAGYIHVSFSKEGL